MSAGPDRDADYLSETVATEADRPSRISVYDGLLRSSDAISYHREDGVYRLAYDREVDATSTAVIAAVAAVADTDPVDLDPLYPAIDSEVVDGLFDPSAAGRGRSGVRVSFQYSGLEITATGHEITVAQPM